MWLGRKEKMNKIDVRVYGLRLKCLTLPPRFNLSPWEIRFQLLVVIQFVSTSYEKFCAYPLSTLTLDLFYFEKTRRDDYGIECKAFILHNATPLYHVLAFVLGIFL